MCLHAIVMNAFYEPIKNGMELGVQEWWDVCLNNTLIFLGFNTLLHQSYV